MRNARSSEPGRRYDGLAGRRVVWRSTPPTPARGTLPPGCRPLGSVTSLLPCKSEDPRASVAASNARLDRGYGKPVAPIEMDYHVNEFDGMTEEELEESIGEQMSKLGLKIEEA